MKKKPETDKEGDLIWMFIRKKQHSKEKGQNLAGNETEYRRYLVLQSKLLLFCVILPKLNLKNWIDYV
jgi:hypothetical protein